MVSECHFWANGAPKNEDRMKKGMLVVLFVVTVVSLAFPRAGHAWGHRYGWYAPGAFVGGALFGAALARPYYAYPPPPPVYAYPAPVYAYPAPAPSYAYPPQQGPYTHPGTPGPYQSSGYQSEGPPGEWITVPGQYVGGTWVPEHEVQVPAN
jgi:hypothetical protein